MGKDEHKGDLYPESWGFCSFLLAHPKYEETKSQIPNGKYWTVLSSYIKLLSDGKTDPEAAFRASFQLNNKALDLDVLEKEWIEYIRSNDRAGIRLRLPDSKGLTPPFRWRTLGPRARVTRLRQGFGGFRPMLLEAPHFSGEAHPV